MSSPGRDSFTNFLYGAPKCPVSAPTTGRTIEKSVKTYWQRNRPCSMSMPMRSRFARLQCARPGFLLSFVPCPANSKGLGTGTVTQHSYKGNLRWDARKRVYAHTCELIPCPAHPIHPVAKLTNALQWCQARYEVRPHCQLAQIGMSFGQTRALPAKLTVKQANCASMCP